MASYFTGVIYKPVIARAVKSPLTKKESPLTLERNFFDPSHIYTNAHISNAMNGEISLGLFGTEGREYRLYVHKTLSAGEYDYKVMMPANLAGGMYFLRLTSGEGIFSRKIIVSK